MRAFEDRSDAGRQLAGKLDHLRQEHPLVLGLPRGGVPVAAEVADLLDAPLDVLMIRKLGVPHHEELAMGAIGEGSVKILNHGVISSNQVTTAQLEQVEALERRELERRVVQYRGNRRPIVLDDRLVVVVDDGVATGASARAACSIARARGARRVVLAVPVAPADWATSMGRSADEYVAVLTPSRLLAIGQWYDDFSQTTDDEVIRMLQERTDPAR